MSSSDSARSSDGSLAKPTDPAAASVSGPASGRSLERHTRTLLTIIAEALLERALIEDCRRLGAQGYTVMDVRGGGPGGERAGQWEAERSIEMQVVCSAQVAELIAAHSLKVHAPNYAIRVLVSEVGVFRQTMF